MCVHVCDVVGAYKKDVGVRKNFRFDLGETIILFVATWWHLGDAWAGRIRGTYLLNACTGMVSPLLCRVYGCTWAGPLSPAHTGF